MTAFTSVPLCGAVHGEGGRQAVRTVTAIVAEEQNRCQWEDLRVTPAPRIWIVPLDVNSPYGKDVDFSSLPFQAGLSGLAGTPLKSCKWNSNGDLAILAKRVQRAQAGPLPNSLPSRPFSNVTVNIFP